jgi:TIGR00252 family protein
MISQNRNIGHWGEDYAADYIEGLGYVILCRNFRCKCGEIDIIAKEKNYIIFIEVKTRYSTRFGIPVEAVTPSKQFKICKTAQYYIMKYNPSTYFYRFDIIEVCADYNSNSIAVNIIKNAFSM